MKPVQADRLGMGGDQYYDLVSIMQQYISHHNVKLIMTSIHVSCCISM